MPLPIHLKILQALEADIAEGRLRPGDIVPSHRAAARAWGVATATVTRAYQEAARRGLLTGRPGAPTRVAPLHAAAQVTLTPSRTARHNLADNIPRTPSELNAGALLRDAFDRLGKGRAQQLLERERPGEDDPEQGRVLGDWLGVLGIPTASRNVLPAPGAQSALLVALRTLAFDGTVACEPLINPGLIMAARFTGTRLAPLACDEQGPRPESLEAAIVRQGVRALYASPTCSNPLAYHWSPERRADLAALAREHRLWLIEDDDLRPLDRHTPTIASLAPERCVSIVGSSKLAGFALRTAVVAVPEAIAPAFAAHLRAATWMASPLLVDILAHWHERGQLETLALARGKEAASRQQQAAAALGRFGYRGPACGLHGWLPLPPGWDGERFAFHAGQRGIAVTPDREFMPLPGSRRPPVSGVRLALAGSGHMRTALAHLVKLLEQGPALRGSP